MVPLIVAVPLFAAAVLIGVAALWKELPRSVLDGTASATAVAVTALCAVAFVRSSSSTMLVWLGSWRPQHGLVVGIPFFVDPFAAGSAGVAAALVTTSLWFTWRRFNTSGALFHALMLVFLAAMIGFSFSA